MAPLKLLSWNVNGIRAVHRKGALEDFLSLEADIYCLQEIKANEETVPKEIMERDDFHISLSTAERKGYSGVAIFSKTPPVSIQTGFGIKEFDNEGRTIIADFGDFTLFNIYFPNGKASKERLQYKMDFYGAFLDYSERLRKSGKSIIVCGDVNTAHQEIDIARPKENEKVSGFLPIERQWIDKFLSYGYIDSFRALNPDTVAYSWWDLKTRARERNVGWRIDYFYVSEDLNDHLKSAFILPEVMGSDHCPVGIEIEI